MSSKKPKVAKKVPELLVVFDTSVLYTGSEIDLVRNEVVDLVKEHGQHQDLAITWYFPEVVRHERQFQMQSRASGLIHPIERLERILGHKLNITEDIVKQRINDAIDSQMNDLNLNKLELNTEAVDWKRLILDACYRKLPFAVGEKEKGFRDALIAETFMQLVAKSPKSRERYRIVLVAGDEGLRDAVQERTKGTKNTHILTSIDELKGLINTLIAEVTEQFVRSIRERAKIYFFDVELKEGLYYREKIRNKIRKRFKRILEELPQGADERINKSWFISVPRFMEKEVQRVFWATKITVTAEAYRSPTLFRYAWPSSASEVGTLPDISAFGPSGELFLGEIKGKPSEEELWLTPPISITPNIRAASIGSVGVGGIGTVGPLGISAVPNKELVSKGETVFEVVWSVVLTTKRNFKFPKIESINHVMTNWE